MPIENWEKVHKGDYSYVLHAPVELNRFQKLFCIRQWESIYETYIIRFGFSENFLNILRQQKKVAKLQAKKIITGDKTLQALIDIAKIELDQLRQSGESMDMYEMCASMARGMGFSINPKTTTVAEFFSYMKALSKPHAGGRR